MITKPKARKFRIRRSGSSQAGNSAPQPEADRVAPYVARQADLVAGPVLPQTAANAASAAQANDAEQVTPPEGAAAKAGGHERAAPAASPAHSGAGHDAPQQGGAPSSDPPEDEESALAAIRREGLTGRQLRMARRVAQKQGLPVTSDYDAVRQLRLRGLDPFQRSTILELVVPQGEGAPGSGSGVGRSQNMAVGAPFAQLPQTMPPPSRNLPSTERASPADRRATEIKKIQRDIGRRRRRLSALLFARLAFFVMLPTFLAGWYFYAIATPMYATKSEFVIQQAEPQGAAGLGGMFAGTSMATQQDSITVQSYLTSRAALLRLDQDYNFKDHFSQPHIDPIQRLADAASNEAAYKIYENHVKISYDPTEGIIKMEVIAADPDTSQIFSEALIGYAEEQVDQLTQRLRGDQMAGARESYEAAEARRAAALAELLRIQETLQQIDPAGETAARTQQIARLETDRQRLQLQLQTRLNVTRPNEAQVNALRSEIAAIENLIAEMRVDMTEVTSAGSSLASRNTELRLAEENYTFQTLLVQQALQQMESSQIEANRQVRYLSLGVEPVAPDEPTYPRAFENTLLAFLVFAGIYLMISLTASILREQIAS